VGALSFTGEFKCWAYLEQAMHTGTNDEQLESADQKSIFRQRYRGDKHKGLESVSVDPLRRGAISKWLWQLIKQRAAIEPTIGRMKGENPRERNRLKGTC
jgi:hypothetical protein